MLRSEKQLNGQYTQWCSIAVREAVSFSKLAVSIALISAHRWDAISGCPWFSPLVSQSVVLA